MRRNGSPAGDASADPVLQFMRLIWAVDHQLQSVSKRMEVSLGLTVPQRMTLLFIGRHPGILASELATLLHLHPGTISGVVRRLETAGLVERTGDDEDARRMRLSLTDTGRAANRRRSGTFESVVRDLMTAAAPHDLDAAGRVLTDLATRLRKAADAHAANEPVARAR
jgi:DNA-binding MarR family transcriptional regulator